MMPREGLIERMAINMFMANGYNQELWSVLGNKLRATYLRMAEASLQALLESLPEPVNGYQNKHDMYYRQLLNMRK